LLFVSGQQTPRIKIPQKYISLRGTINRKYCSKPIFLKFCNFPKFSVAPILTIIMHSTVVTGDVGEGKGTRNASFSIEEPTRKLRID
jgi:hypothetical protein